MDSPLDLSKVRHDLRTPINHIVGYCEMLMEEPDLPERLQADLAKIHGGGKRLLELIGQYFNEATFGAKRDLQQLQHELRTPVNHIIGYSELLQEIATETRTERLIPDLRRIHEGAVQWLALMEEHLIPAPAMFDPEDDGSARDVAPPAFVSPGITFQTLRPRSADTSPHWNAHVLVVDDDPANRELLARRLQRYGARTSLAQSGVEALQLLRKDAFDLVLLDLLMPGLDGYQVLVKLKADTRLRHIPVIMVSGLDQENGVARCLEMGAEDYLTKPFNPVFLRARIGACLEKKHWRDQEQATHRALVRSQEHLLKELAEAGAYVRSLLPAPLSGPVAAAWCFQPSEQLGGDAFGYHWIDEDRLAIYLLDVCGHGVGAALLSVSALNGLRSPALVGGDLSNPAQLLGALNRIFQMDRQNQMYFTLWYGVFDRRDRQLEFASAGHPPALLLTRGTGAAAGSLPLRTSGPPIGTFPDFAYPAGSTVIAEGSQLLVFSDGCFELAKPDGTTGTLGEFQASIEAAARAGVLNPGHVVSSAIRSAAGQKLEDDFSMLHFVFE